MFFQEPPKTHCLRLIKILIVEGDALFQLHDNSCIIIHENVGANSTQVKGREDSFSQLKIQRFTNFHA